jgi:hypothetical protein
VAGFDISGVETLGSAAGYLETKRWKFYALIRHTKDAFLKESK